MLTNDPVLVVRGALRHGLDLGGRGAQRGRRAVQRAQQPAAGQQRCRAEPEAQGRAHHHQAPWNFGGRFSMRATCASMTSWLDHALSNKSLCSGHWSS